MSIADGVRRALADLDRAGYPVGQEDEQGAMRAFIALRDAVAGQRPESLLVHWPRLQSDRIWQWLFHRALEATNAGVSVRELLVAVWGWLRQRSATEVVGSPLLFDVNPAPEPPATEASAQVRELAEEGGVP